MRLVRTDTIPHREWRFLLLALLAYLGIYLAYTYPLCLHLTDRIVGLDNDWADTPSILSNLYLFEKNMAEGNSFFVDELFFPLGSSTWLHGYFPLLGLISLAFGNKMLFLNIYLMFAFPVAGLGVYRLARYLQLNPLWAFTAGFLYAFAPYRLTQFQDHYWYVFAFTIPWFIYSALRTFAFTPGRFLPVIRSFPGFLITVLLAVITLGIDHYSTLFLCVFSLMLAVANYLLPRLSSLRFSRKTALVLAAALIIPQLLVSLFRSFHLKDKGAAYWSADLLGYVIPMNSRFFDNSFFQGIYGETLQLKNNSEYHLFLGWAFLLLVLFLLVRYYRNKDKSTDMVLWGFLSLIFFLFTMPEIKVAGKTLLAGPTALLHYFPGFNNLRVPPRYFLLLGICLPLFAGLMLQQTDSKKRTVISLAVLLLSLIEYTPKPFEFFTSKKDHPDYLFIRSLPGKTLLTIPGGVRDGFRQLGRVDTRDLYFQTLHHKNLIGGYFSRVSDDLFSFHAQDPWLQALYQSELSADPKPDPLTPENTREFLRVFQPDIIAIRRDFLNSSSDSLVKHTLLKEGAWMVKEGQNLQIWYRQ